MAISKLTGQYARIGPGFNTYVIKKAINSTPTGSEQNLGVTLPSNCIVFDVFINVRVAEETGGTTLMDVGTNGAGPPSNDPDGFLDGVDVGTTGIKKGTLASGGQTLGALLRVDEGGTGELVPEPDVSSGGSPVTYTASANDWAEFRGDIYIVLAKLL